MSAQNYYTCDEYEHMLDNRARLKQIERRIRELESMPYNDPEKDDDELQALKGALDDYAP